ncbi:hypothetical protein BC834DRAFT_837041 [Gloeopeniophorella convolvens]|nr:hypothetical protein BC834DRAFT_837041 [Gloeopeniophorella convolvens]
MRPSRFRQIPAFSGVRAFSDNVSGLSCIAARDYKDILQCMMPCFEGLLEEPHNDSVMSLLYTMATWHALAKMRMHTDSSLQLLDDVMIAIGVRLRHFAIVTCAPFQTKETEREYLAWKQDEAHQSIMSTERSDSRSTEPGRRVRRFHLRTIKTHFLRDYVASIKYMGTTDSTSTQIVSLLPMCGTQTYEHTPRASKNTAGSRLAMLAPISGMLMLNLLT